MHSKDLFTFLSNKDGHGKRGRLIAAVRGTQSEDVIRQFMQIPQKQREAVKEVTMDLADSMYAIVKEVFPNASIVIDCFQDERFQSRTQRGYVTCLSYMYRCCMIGG